MSLRVIDRKEKILKELLSHEGFVTSGMLSVKLGVSSRTIRKDIKQLTLGLLERGIELSAVPSKGFHLNDADREKAASYLLALKHITSDIPTLPIERMKSILRKLLFDGQCIDLDELSAEFYVSRSTVERDLREVRQWLSTQGLELKNEPTGISIAGSEPLIRVAMVNYFSGFDNLALPNLEDLMKIVGKEVVEPVRNLLYQFNDTQKISLSDAEFLNLIIYLSVSVLRIRSRKEIAQDNSESPTVEINKSDVLALEIVEEIEQNFPIQFSQSELIHLTKYMMQTNILASSLYSESFLNGNDFTEFVHELIEDLNARFGLTFSKDRELKRSLILYFNSLRYQKKHKTLVKNPGLGEISTHYPDALEMAVFASEKLKEEFDLILNEHEIGYIALFFCAALERQKMQDDKVNAKVAIICATGSGGSQLLAVKIRRHFPNLEIVGIYPTYRLSEALKQDPDFIISTNPIQEANFPIVHISHVLDDEDLLSIKKTLDDYNHNKKWGWRELFRADLFFPEIALDKKMDVIHFLCEQIKLHGYVGDSFASAVLKREAIFPTSIGNLVAIPHALTRQTPKSWIAIGLLKKPIHWGNDLAQIILLLNINNAEEDNFTTIYEMLFDMVNDKKTVERLLRTTKFEEFLKVINE